MSRILFAISILILLAQNSAGQSPEVAFHDGARVYVDARLEEAEEIVDAGLAIDPTNPKLTALKALIQEEKDRQQQSGEGSSGEQQEQDQSQQPQPNQSGDEPDPSADEEGEGQQEEQEQPGQGDPQPQDPSQEQQASDREQESVEAGADPDQLSRAQAIRILQALQNEEEQLLREVQKIKGRPRRVDKDW